MDELDGGPTYNASMLRDTRQSLGFTQQQMGSYMGLSMRAYQALEGGQNPVKRSHILMSMATQFLLVGADLRDDLVTKIDPWLVEYAREIARAAETAKVKRPPIF